MLALCWLLFVESFHTTASYHSVLTWKPGIKDRRGNLAPKRVSEFENKNSAADVDFSGTLQDDVSKSKTVINKNNIHRRDFNSDRLQTFTDFINNAIKVVNKFDDADLEDFFAVFNDEVRKYHYRGCKFYELTENYDLRKFIANQLDGLNYLSAKNIRNILVAIAAKIEKEDFSNIEKDVIDFVNSLYTHDSIDTFKYTLVKLDDYRLKDKNYTNLPKIVREGLRSIIFDHFTKLNHNARVALKTKIDEYWHYLMDFSSTFLSEQNENAIKLRSYSNTKVVNTKANKAKQNGDKLKIIKSITRTKNTKTDIYINLNKDLYVNCRKSFHMHTTKSKSKMRKITFKTLYPKFVTDHEAPKFKAEIISTAGKDEFVWWREHDEYLQINNKSKLYDDDVDIAFKSRRKKQSTTKKNTGKTTMRQVYIEKNLDLKYDPYAYDKFTTEFKNTHKRTYLTLYPAITEESTTRKSRIGKKRFAPVPSKNIMRTLMYEEIEESYTGYLQKVQPRAALPTEHERVLQVVTMRPYEPRNIISDKKIKFEVNINADEQLHPKLFLKKPEFRFNIPMAQIADPNLNLRSNQYYEDFEDTTPILDRQCKISSIKNINFKKKYPDNATKEVSAEEMIEGKYRRAYRKSLKNRSKDTIVVDQHILTRIQDLEELLKLVKTQINNDSKIIKDLNSKVYRKSKNPNEYDGTYMFHNLYNKEWKAKPMKKVVIDLAAQINVDNGQLRKNFHNDASNRDLENTFKTTNYLRKPYLSHSKKYIRTSDKSIYNNTLSKYTVDIDDKTQAWNYTERNGVIAPKVFYHNYKLKTYAKPTHAESYPYNKTSRQNIVKSNIKTLVDNDVSNHLVRDNDKYSTVTEESVKKRFELNSFASDKVDHHTNNNNERKYQFNRKTFNNDEINNKPVKKNNVVYKNKKYDMSKNEKDQEIKYYSSDKNYPMYDEDWGKNMKTKERIYSDSNKGYNKKDLKEKENNKDYFVKTTLNQVDEKPNKFFDDYGMDRTFSTKYKKREKSILNNLHDFDVKRLTIYGLDNKFVTTAETLYKHDLNSNNYKDATINYSDLSNQVQGSKNQLTDRKERKHLSKLKAYEIDKYKTTSENPPTYSKDEAEDKKSSNLRKNPLENRNAMEFESNIHINSHEQKLSIEVNKLIKDTIIENYLQKTPIQGSINHLNNHDDQTRLTKLSTHTKEHTTKYGKILNTYSKDTTKDKMLFKPKKYTLEDKTNNFSLQNQKQPEKNKQIRDIIFDNQVQRLYDSANTDNDFIRKPKHLKHYSLGEINIKDTTYQDFLHHDARLMDSASNPNTSGSKKIENKHINDSATKMVILYDDSNVNKAYHKHSSVNQRQKDTKEISSTAVEEKRYKYMNNEYKLKEGKLSETTPNAHEIEEKYAINKQKADLYHSNNNDDITKGITNKAQKYDKNNIKLNDFVFKADPDKDILYRYGDHHDPYLDTNYNQTGFHKDYTYTSNKSNNYNFSSKEDLHEDKHLNRNETIKDKHQNTTQIETTTENLDLNISKENENYMALENNSYNRTMNSTTLKPNLAIPRAIKTIETLTTIKSRFAETSREKNATSARLAASTTYTLGTIDSDIIIIMRTQNQSTPEDNRIIAEINPTDQINLTMVENEEIPRADDFSSLALLRQFERKDNNTLVDFQPTVITPTIEFDTLIRKTHDIYRKRKNESELLDPDTYDLLKKYVASSNMSDPGLVPSPNYKVPKEYDDMVFHGGLPNSA